MSTRIQAPSRTEHSASHRRGGALKDRLATASVTAVLVALVIGYLAGPAAWQWVVAKDHYDHLSTNPNSVFDQFSNVPAGPIDSSLVARLNTASTSQQSGPIILTYHDISYRGGEYTVTPEAFAGQMQLLADSGWQTTTAAQLRDWINGKPLPPHSVQVTFDDGARGVWQYADPILARNNQHAVAYIVTGFVGTRGPYYMTWPELTKLQQSGRWDIEAHTHRGHVEVPIDAEGHSGPFLTNLQYLTEQHRVETADEYRTRITADLQESKTQIAAHGFPEPEFFAYPFSAHSSPPGTDGALTKVVASLFTAAMLDQPHSAVATSADNMAEGNLARMDTTSDTSLGAFADKILEVSPLNPPDSVPLGMPAAWTTYDEQPVVLPAKADTGVSLDPGPGAFISRLFAPLKTRLWTSYTVEATLGGFEKAWDGTTAGVTVLTKDPQQIEVAVSANDYRITQENDAGGKELAKGPLPESKAHELRVVVSPDAVFVSIDGSQVSATPLLPGIGHRGAAGSVQITGYRRDAASPVPRIDRLRLT